MVESQKKSKKSSSRKKTEPVVPLPIRFRGDLPPRRFRGDTEHQTSK